jgi:hypothetical protein
MDKEETEKENKHCECCEDDWRHWRHHHHYWHRGHSGGALYTLGFFGALFYFLQHAVTASDFLWGILKAIVWPALAVFKLLTIWKI